MGALPPEAVAAVVAAGASARVDDAKVSPRFVPGDRVVMRNINPPGHTRLPRYVRGKRGTIDRDHGVFVFPDSHAHGQGEKPQHVYSVRFAAAEVWGPEGDDNNSLYVDVWDDYMEPEPL